MTDSAAANAPSSTAETVSPCPMSAEPGPQHAWLAKLVGEWSYVSRCSADPNDPDAEPMTATGTESVRMIGDYWAVGENHGEAPGMGPMHARMTIGFDPMKGKFVGHWFCSIMPGQFVYEGELDSDERVLTLDTEGPDFTDPSRTARYQDVVELVDNNTRVMRSRMQGTDGSWIDIMRADFTRTNA